MPRIPREKYAKQRAAVDARKETENDRRQRMTSNPHLSYFLNTNSSGSILVPVLGNHRNPLSVDVNNCESIASDPVNAPEPDSKRAKLTEQLQDFQDNKELLIDYLFDHDHHPLIGLPCGCGRGKHLVCCSDCLGHNATCEECFISSHLTMPCHWANVWQEEMGFFARRDISRLFEGEEHRYAIPLGHGGQRCPAGSSKPNLFHIIDHNGVHETLVHFCSCHGHPNRVQQLIQFGLFPATFRRPAMAFTLTVLKQFHIHHLESKESAYDFIGSLRRLTDNMFASQTCDPYPQFLTVMRFWHVLIATKRLGQAHGIDTLIPHRPAGNLIVLCPSCPEVGLNMEPLWRETPLSFSHLHQLQITFDGNFHANRYKKNSSDNDYSLFEGRSYYPLDTDFKSYLRSLPNQDIADKIECPLKAVKNRNLVMDNLSETGTINIQCPHVIVRSTVDLQRGERFANTDYALAVALRQIKDLDNVDDQYLTSLGLWGSYDMMCSYFKNVVKRFETNFPDLVNVVRRLRPLIPLVHVHNHKENCDYLYSSAYLTGAGHFHGETAEHEWAELNQLAPQVQQMNNGHRQDTLLDHHGDWNFKKLSNMSASLESDIVHSRKVFTKKHESFLTMTASYADRAAEWNTLDRELRTMGADKEIQCVFRQKTGKVPSQAKIYQAIVDRIKSRSETLGRIPSSAVTAISFLNEGIILERKQLELASKISSSDSYLTDEEIASRRKKLASSIKAWKLVQNDIMSLAVDGLHHRQISSIDEPEHACLHLPSSFSSLDRSKYELDALAADEIQLRKGGIFDHIRTIQDTSKLLSVLRTDRQQNDRGQTARTRSASKLEETERRLTVHISTYNWCRNALVALGGVEYSAMFPTMSIADTYRMPTHTRRELGTSRISNGRIFHGGVNGGTIVKSLVSTQYTQSYLPSGSAASLIGTIGHKAKPRSDKKLGKDKKGTNRGSGITEVEEADMDITSNDKPVKPDGWIWSLGGMDNLSSEELQAWSDESDRVQWFRAEAEMLRWQEENEINQAQFLRCIRTFRVMCSHWSTLAGMNANSPGRAAYAKKTAARFARLEHEARERLRAAGYPYLVENHTSDHSEPLYKLIAKKREELYLPLLNLLSPQSIVTPTTFNGV